jgi:cysteine-rich repeat protein
MANQLKSIGNGMVKKPAIRKGVLALLAIVGFMTIYSNTNGFTMPADDLIPIIDIPIDKQQLAMGLVLDTDKTNDDYHRLPNGNVNFLVYFNGMDEAMVNSNCKSGQNSVFLMRDGVYSGGGIFNSSFEYAFAPVTFPAVGTFKFSAVCAIHTSIPKLDGTGKPIPGSNTDKYTNLLVSDEIVIKVDKCGDGYVFGGPNLNIGKCIKDNLACSSPNDFMCNWSGEVCVPDDECDDGNNVSGDGCSATCKIESGWKCPLNLTDGGVTGKSGTCEKKCGDGYVLGGTLGNEGHCAMAKDVICRGYDQCPMYDSCIPNEECDDKNQASGDGCSSTCQIETGWSCPTLMGVGLACACANGYHRSGSLCKLNTDLASCGTADNSAACPASPANGAATCSGTPPSCGFTCNPGYTGDDKSCKDSTPPTITITKDASTASVSIDTVSAQIEDIGSGLDYEKVRYETVRSPDLCDLSISRKTVDIIMVRGNLYEDSDADQKIGDPITIPAGNDGNYLCFVAADIVGNMSSKATSQLHVLSDEDGDGVSDAVDNCPAVANADQANSDANPLGDACQITYDSIGDAISIFRFGGGSPVQMKLYDIYSEAKQGLGSDGKITVDDIAELVSVFRFYGK